MKKNLLLIILLAMLICISAACTAKNIQKENSAQTDPAALEYAQKCVNAMFSFDTGFVRGMYVPASENDILKIRREALYLEIEKKHLERKQKMLTYETVFLSGCVFENSDVIFVGKYESVEAFEKLQVFDFRVDYDVTDQGSYSMPVSLLVGKYSGEYRLADITLGTVEVRRLLETADITFTLFGEPHPEMEDFAEYRPKLKADITSSELAALFISSLTDKKTDAYFLRAVDSDHRGEAAQEIFDALVMGDMAEYFGMEKPQYEICGEEQLSDDEWMAVKTSGMTAGKELFHAVTRVKARVFDGNGELFMYIYTAEYNGNPAVIYVD